MVGGYLSILAPMESAIEIILSCAYAGLFLFLISKLKFFRSLEVPMSWIQGTFILKVLSGVLLYLIYTRYYTDRSTADIFKYFDDSLVLYNAAFEKPLDFLKMMFSFRNDNAYFNDTYYDVMNNWNRPYGSSLGNDTHTIIRFNALTRFISLGYYNVHSVILNFLSLMGLAGIFHFLKRLVPSTPRFLFLLVFLFPGVMFWGSGVLKEGLLFFGLGMMLYSVVRFLPDKISGSKPNFLWAGGIVLSFLFLTTVKSYALIAIVPGIVALRIVHWKGGGWKPVFALYGIGVILALSIGTLFPDSDPLGRLVHKQKDFISLARGGTYILTNDHAGDTLYILPEFHGTLEFNDRRSSARTSEPVQAVHWSDARRLETEPSIIQRGEEITVLLDNGNAGSRIEIPELEPNVWSFIKTTPSAFVNGLFRPFPWEARSPFMLLALIENFILVVLLTLMFWKFGRAGVNWPYWWIAVFFSLAIILLTGWVTPVIGAIVRYKVPALPFLAAAIVALIDQGYLQKIEKRLSILG